MEGHRQFTKLLKLLRRRGFLEGKNITAAEWKGLRLRYGLSREQLAGWLETSADVLAQIESVNVDQFLDGGLHRVLTCFVKQMPSKPPPEPAPEVEVESHSFVPTVEKLLPALPPATEPPLLPVVEAKEPTLSASDARVLARVAALDLTDPKLATVDQRFQRFCEFWVAEHKIKRFSLSKKGKMSIPSVLRDAVIEITGGEKPQFLANWRLYRHVKRGSKHKMAMESVRSGDVSAVSALMDYDEKGRALRGEKSKKATKKVSKKSRSKSGTGKVKALTESGARLTAIPKRTPSSKRKTAKELKGAQEVQEAVGALKLRLAAIRSDFSGDQRLVTLIEGITQSVDPIHHKLKQLVLRRATKSRTK
jgi:hypothetical protein